MISVFNFIAKDKITSSDQTSKSSEKLYFNNNGLQKYLKYLIFALV